LETCERSNMAEVTVKQLAGVVGIPVEKLLKQMQAAGLEHGAEDQAVSDVEKQKLLAYLKKEHGQTQGDKKITLKRKSVSKLKVSGSQGRSKTVNVEVRKKRTYVKRSVIEEEQKAEEEAKLAEAAALEAAAQEAAAQEAAAQESAEDSEEVAQQESTEVAPVEDETSDVEKLAADSVESSADQIEAEAKVEGVSTQVDPVSAPDTQSASTKRARLAEASSLSSAAKIDSKKLVAEKTVKSDDKKERQQSSAHAEKARQEAEERARQQTLENAKRVAEELEKRKGEKKVEIEQDEEDVLVKQAFEESIEQEEKRARRKKDKRVRAKILAKKAAQQHAFTQPTQPIIREVQLGEQIIVADLANQMSVKGAEVVKELMKMGVMVTVNQWIDQETAVLVCEELGHRYVLRSESELEDNLFSTISSLFEQSGVEEVQRAPVVTIMGHVDHGKTSLLDYIRRSKVASDEAGGITQHIGAYHVETDKGMVTFLDTPGHAAFTAMRARGAKSTDIVVLVVAADDGMMPQTEEAIDHARAASVPIVVAVNKIDKEDADPDRVRNELSSKKELIPESWGGDIQYVNVSAHTGEGIDELLDSCLLQAELLELKAAAEGPAKGVVVEARLDKGRGVVATLLVQSGELKQGDMILAGPYYGRVRAMVDENGHPIEKAGPSIPVEILGLAGTPEAGDEFLVVPDERKAKEVAEFRITKQREQRLARQQKAKLEKIFENLGSEEKATVNIILKADVRGSLEALHGALAEIGNDEVSVAIVGGGIGGINESDANLALTTGAVIIGFNVRADTSARRICQEEGIEVRYYSVIYDIIEDMKAALTGLLEPELRENILGIAEVRDVFRSSKFGAVAGCMVVEGALFRNKKIRVLRDEVVVFEGELESLRRFKDDVSEVRLGTECGVAVRGYKDVKAGDKIEAFDVKAIARTL